LQVLKINTVVYFYIITGNFRSFKNPGKGWDINPASVQIICTERMDRYMRMNDLSNLSLEVSVSTESINHPTPE